jgi:hypothetical protein
MYRYLTNEAHFASDHVVLLTNQSATKEKIMHSIDWCSKQMTSADLMLIYYRSRGVSLTGNKPSYSAALATSDTSPERIPETSFQMSEYFRLISKSFPAKRLILITDADLSSNIDEDIVRIDFDEDERLNQRRIIDVYCSARNTQLTWESNSLRGSIFTQELLKSLRRKKSRGDIGACVGSIHKVLQTIVPKIRPYHEQQVDTASIYTTNEHVEARIDAIPERPRVIH